MKLGIDCTGIAITFCCHNGKGKFLLQKRSRNCPDNKGAWQFGGGKLEYGESVQDGVLREVKEEYGCDGIINQALPAKSTVNESGHWITLPHIIQVDETETKLNEPDKADEIGWFTLDALPSPLHSGTILFLKEHRELLEKYI